MSTGRENSLGLIATKLHQPLKAADLLRRERLFDLLERGAESPLTLVSAPAGYGKSVVVGDWAARGARRVAWVSLDRSDSGLPTFLAYLFAAIEGQLPGVVRESGALLDATTALSAGAFAGQLLNDFEASSDPCTVVLDDYHRIAQRSAVHELISAMLDHPSSRVRFVLISRRDPPLDLTALRARGHLHEIRLRDLRFTRTETTEFLRTASETGVSESALARLDAAVEGWAVGLRFVALALRHVGDPESFLGQLEGGLPGAQAYLVQEVLAQQPPAVRELLMASSVLDRFCAGLIDTLSDPADGAVEISGADFIREIEESGLFAVPLDTTGEWFRYHHLFQELLFQELLRARGELAAATLRRRASAWLERQGLVREALEQAFEVGEPEYAADVLERHLHQRTDPRRIPSMSGWLHELPGEVVETRPQLLWARTKVRYALMDIPGLLSDADRIDRLLDVGDAPHELSGEVAAYRGLGAMLSGDSARALDHLERAFELANASDQGSQRLLSELLFGLAGQMQGQRERVAAILRARLERTEPIGSVCEVNLTQTLSLMSYIDASPRGIDALLRRGRAVARAASVETLAPWNDYIDGMLRLQWGELEDAARYFASAARQRFRHHVRGAVDGMCASAVTQQMLGDEEACAEILPILREFVRATRSSFDPVVESCQIRLAILQGRRDEVARWLERSNPPADEVMLFWFEVPSLTWCRALLFDGSRDRVEEAVRRLRRHLAAAEAHHNVVHEIEVRALLARAGALLGHRSDAVAQLDRALALAEPAGFQLAFLEAAPELPALLVRSELAETGFVARILEAHEASAPEDTSVLEAAPASEGNPPRTAPSPLRDAVTNRELDVLELLAQRLRDKEIAAELHISTLTVKDHLKRIYQKLEVHDRRAAVRRAIDCGLIEKPRPPLAS